MGNLKIFPFSAPLVSIGVLCCFLAQAGHRTLQAPQYLASSPAYIARGEQVEKTYRAYGKLLADYHQALVIAFQDKAADLLAQLQSPEPIKGGYQILPMVLSGGAPEQQIPAAAVGYSWPWTERLIEVERRRIARATAELRYALALSAKQSRPVFERLASDYRSLRQRQQNIDAHVQYNRFWQSAIAADRPGYNRETSLLYEVIERQGMHNELKSLTDAFPFSSFSPKILNGGVGLAALTNELSRREASLARRIDTRLGRLSMPGFIATEHRAHESIFRVPVYTDIADRNFVATVKRIIEAIWNLRDGAREFRVELDITYVPSKSLYPDGAMPAVGEPIDLPRHLQRFPADAAILTTGALTTHVQSYAIVLGPHPITPRILAHEFGHLLCFRDAYVRGYEDLGKDGFQILEVSTDPTDIMADPVAGSVQVKHFEMLLNKRFDKTPRVSTDIRA